MAKICAVIPAAGRGLRMGHKQPKQFLELAGRPILSHTLEAMSRLRPVPDIILVVPQDCLAQAGELLQQHGGQSNQADRLQHDGIAAKLSDRSPSREPVTIITGDGVRITTVAGGIERQDSIFNALRVLPEECEWVIVHDGVRPFVSLQLLQETLDAARQTGAAITAVPVTDTIKQVRRQLVAATIPRDNLWLVQTPQVFRKDIILQAYREARRHGWTGTDDASLVEQLEIPVQVVQGERSNIKITTPEDLEWGAWLLERRRRQEKNALSPTAS